MGQSPDTDDELNAHGTKVASKALGKLYGVAKDATVIPVKLTMEQKASQVLLGYKAALRDIEEIEENGKTQKSIVVCSLSVGEGLTRDTALNHPHGRLFQYYLERFFELGVPVVVAAGNEADKPGLENIAAMPMVLENAETPIIVVGAKSPDGTRAPFSRVGPQLTIYAPGNPVQAHGKIDGEELVDSGTSFGKSSLVKTYIYDILTSSDSCTGCGGHNCDIYGLR
jgi:hypothetical protein